MIKRSVRAMGPTRPEVEVSHREHARYITPPGGDRLALVVEDVAAHAGDWLADPGVAVADVRVIGGIGNGDVPVVTRLRTVTEVDLRHRGAHLDRGEDECCRLRLRRCGDVSRAARGDQEGSCADCERNRTGGKNRCGHHETSGCSGRLLFQGTPADPASASGYIIERTRRDRFAEALHLYNRKFVQNASQAGRCRRIPSYRRSRDVFGRTAGKEERRANRGTLSVGSVRRQLLHAAGT